jgi:5-amino-6-(5-phospho-D-ribitylamino)uracil phosphatase
MKNLRHLFFVTDLDKTLLRSDATLSDYSAMRLSRFVQEGIQITFATARGLLSTKSIINGVKIKLPQIFYNGALLVDGEGEVIEEYLLSERTIRSIIEIAELFLCNPMILARHPVSSLLREKIIYFKLSNFGEEFFIENRKCLGCTENVDIFDETTPVYSVLFIDKYDKVVALQQAIDLECSDTTASKIIKDPYIEDFCYLEVYTKYVDKGRALKLLIERLGIKNENVVVFGDERNDLGMFDRAGVSFAVKNAHPEVLKKAHYIAESNDEDGVVKFLEKYCAYYTSNH